MGTPSTDTTVTPKQQATKSKHAEYIDIARVLAAFSIIILHLSIDWIVKGGVSSAMLNGRVPFFFVIAGFFARDPSFAGMRKRLAILVIPFVLWDTIPAFLFDHLNWRDLNIIDFITLKIHFNGPLWFLKNLIIYALIFPFIYHLKKYTLAFGFVCLAICSLQMHWAHLTVPRTIYAEMLGIGFFCLGVGFQQIKLDTITQFFNAYYKTIILIAIPIILSIDLYGALTQNEVFYNPFIQFYGILTLLAVGTAISVNLPKIAQLLLHISPATYFIFLCHYSVCHLIRISWSIPWLSEFYYKHDYITALATAAAIMIFGAFFIKFLRRFAPVLLPIIAGVKRPKKHVVSP